MSTGAAGLFIRADASPQMGTGHVMRCLALGQAARAEGVPVHITGRVAVEWVRKRLEIEGIAFSGLPGPPPATEKPEDLLARLGGSGKGDWVALDGYHFGLDCQQAVRAAGRKLLVIDDYAHLREYSCDILLNQNIGAEEQAYKGDMGRRLLGPKYALLRPEFLLARRRAAERSFPGKAQNILLVLGGGDFSAHLERIAPGLARPQLAGCALRVVTGAMPPERVRGLLRDCPANLEILDRAADMPAIFTAADLCVTAGGSTCWELCCLGTPFLTMEVAENQHDLVLGLQKNGIAPIYAPEALAAMMRDGAARRKCAEAGSALVDGLGAGRVIRAMMELS
jgi:UDP-2,4-diacetamido-2,4,6-trideoxy-beta-L-altropyranose hydrolase